MRRGQKKYKCGECGAESFHHWIELNRAARLRCPGCGSARMELVTQEARKEAAAAMDNQVFGLRSAQTRTEEAKR